MNNKPTESVQMKCDSCGNIDKITDAAGIAETTCSKCGQPHTHIKTSKDPCFVRIR